MANTMEHLSEFVFINVANMTLARRDAYLAHIKAGIKQDTLSALRQAPIHLDKLFPDQILKLDLHIGEPMQICIHRKDNSPKPVNHRLTLKEGQKVKADEDSQPTISCNLVSHCKPLGSIINEL